MKQILLITVFAALALFSSCNKPQTDAERNAEVEKQVQDRLAAEHQTEAQNKLAQQQSDLDAREKSLAARAAEPAEPKATPALNVAESQTVDDANASADDAAYGTFYEKLEPYGSWLETADYGYVWQPRTAELSRGWRPYTEGQWVYSDAGWTWVSEEPFGWATYHYGRWARLKNAGWVWVPGQEWAPAWVSFRSSDSYVGWAPLPPEARFDRRRGIQNWADSYYDIGPDQYSFVRSEEFGRRPNERNILPVNQSVAIVNETTNVTNISYNNTTIVIGGPNYNQMRSRGQAIESYHLERKNSENIAPGKPVVRGDVLEISAPKIAPVSGFTRPRVLRARIAQPSVEHGWDGVGDRAQMEKAREKMKAEATPPPGAPPKVFPRPVRVQPAATSAPIIASTPRPTMIPKIESTPLAAPFTTPLPRVLPTAAAPAPAQTPQILRTPPNRPAQLQQPSEQQRRDEEALRRENFLRNKAHVKGDQTVAPPVENPPVNIAPPKPQASASPEIHERVVPRHPVRPAPNASTTPAP